MHNGFVVDTEGEKMSKSLGNVANLLDLLQHYDPRAYRLVLLQTHYRSPVRIGQDNIDAAVNTLGGLDSFAARSQHTVSAEPDSEVISRFRAFMDDDLDTPSASALLFETVRRANTALDASDASAPALVAAVRSMCAAFGLDLKQASDVPAETLKMAAELDAARAAKDFATADALRAALQADGWIVETNKAGTTVRR
jgi:cysteinyl-tRNA synthetase